MKKLLVILFISISAGIVAYYFLTHAKNETITRRTLVINNCKAEYIHFKHDNIDAIIKTGGHAPNNIMELGGAKIEIAKCLCDSYLTKKSAADSIAIIKILNSEEYLYSKKLFEYSVEDFKTDTLHLQSACKNKEKYFARIFLD